nr:MAG TPA: Chorismate mutase [Caudoviricetes sp.]
MSKYEKITKLENRIMKIDKMIYKLIQKKFESIEKIDELKLK